MRVFALSDKIPTKFQRLCRCFRSRLRKHRHSRSAQLSIGTYENTMRPNRKWKTFKMATSQLQMRVFALSDKISTEFQRLYLRFRGPEFHWNLWEWCATKPEVDSTKCSANARIFDLFTCNDTHMITQFWSTNTTVHMGIRSSEISIFSTFGSGAWYPP